MAKLFSKGMLVVKCLRSVDGVGGVTTMQLSWQFIKLSATSLVGYALGFLIQILLSRYFGTSSTVDAYWVAMTLVNMCGFFVHPAREALVSGFHDRLRDNSSDIACLYVSSVINFLMILLFVGCILLLLFPSFLSGLIVGPSRQTLGDEVVSMMPFAVTLVPLVAITDIYNGILVSQGKIFIQDLARIIGSFMAVIFLFLFASRVGIVSIIVSGIIANIVILVVQRYEAKNIKFYYHVAASPLVDRSFVSMSGLLILSYLVSQIYTIYERKVFVTLADGALAGFQYAITLNNVVSAIIIGSICNLIWHEIYKLIASREDNAIISLIAQSLKKLAILIIFVELYCVVYAESLVYVLFYGGKFDIKSLLLTAMFLKSVLLSLLPLAISGVLGRLFVSKRNTSFLFGIGVASAVGGILVLYCAKYTGNLKIASYHTAVSALCGAGVSLYGAYRVYMARYLRNNFAEMLIWITKMTVISILELLLFLSLPISLNQNKFYVLVELILRFLCGASVYFVAVYFSNSITKMDLCLSAQPNGK